MVRSGTAGGDDPAGPSGGRQAGCDLHGKLVHRQVVRTGRNEKKAAGGDARRHQAGKLAITPGADGQFLAAFDEARGIGDDAAIAFLARPLLQGRENLGPAELAGPANTVCLGRLPGQGNGSLGAVQPVDPGGACRGGLHGNRDPERWCPGPA